ncbi:MAG: aminotransferase class IV [Acidobacteriota bacterium]
MAEGWWFVWSGDGEIRPAPEGRVSGLDHGYLYGAALYETLRTYHARPFALSRHLARLARGAACTGMGVLPLAEMEGALRRLAALRAPEESYLRITVSSGEGPPAPFGTPRGTVRWTALAGPLPPHVAATYERGVRCILSSRPRWNPGGFVPAVKFCANADLWIAKREAEARGAFEALLRNAAGFLAEGASSNVFLVKRKVLVTPDLPSGILDGVTRESLLRLAPRAGVPVEERPVGVEEIYEADEVFLASTLKEVVPVVEVDGRPVGRGEPGMITDRLLGLFQEEALEATSGGAP